MSVSDPEPNKIVNRGGRGDFFAVDLATFHCVCDLGSVDVAHAYLVLAAGTGPDNLTTTWSAEAIKSYTAHGWRKGKEFIARLIEAGLLELVRAGARPRYRLIVPTSSKQIQHGDREIIDRVRRGAKLTQVQLRRAPQLVDAGHLAVREGGDFIIPKARIPQPVWLPKTLVTGADGENGSPLRRIASSRQTDAIRLLVDLYAMQDLAEHGGVDRLGYRRKHERREVVRCGRYIVWSFKAEGQLSVSWFGGLKRYQRDVSSEQKAAGMNSAWHFFRMADVLQAAGVIEWVPTLFEGADDDAPARHTLGVLHNGYYETSGPGADLCRGAYSAATVLMDVVGREMKEFENSFLIPVEAFASEVQVISVARLRYRARTTNAARWLAEEEETRRVFLPKYADIVARHAPRAHSSPRQTSMEVQCDLNEGSMGINETSTVH